MTRLFVTVFFLHFVLVQCFVKINLEKSELKNKPTSFVTVNTTLGKLIGYKQEVQNKTVNAFFGLPFAVPPVGDLRFKRTKLIDKFENGIYRALDFKPHCAMVVNPLIYHKDDVFSEDCLYMNMWTPDLDEIKPNGVCKRKYPVMVYILGANSSAYEMSPLVDANNSTGIAYNGEMFPLKDTIYVVFNYRQQMFASLYLEDRYSGNIALYDQNLAIRFVKKHIDDLCGDSDKLTVFGHSFGAAFLSYHLISRQSKHMIKNAIIQSKAPNLFFNLLPVTKNEVIVNSFLAIYKLGCLNFESVKFFSNMESLDSKIRSYYFDNKKYFNEERLIKKLEQHWNTLETAEYADLKDDNFLKFIKFLSRHAVDLKCLKSVETEKIINLGPIHNSVHWTIYFDLDFIDKKPYLDYKLHNRLDLDKRVNLLIGGVPNEGCKVGLDLALSNKFYTDVFTPPKIPKEVVKSIIKKSNIFSTVQSNFSSVMANVYTDEKRSTLTKGYYESLENFNNDYTFTCPYHLLAYFASFTSNSVSSYYITQPVTKHYMSSLIPYDQSNYAWLGSCHGDELTYLFGKPFKVSNQFTEVDRRFSMKLLDLWTTFAKGKMPKLTNNEEWPTSTRHKPDPKYIEINDDYIRERKFEFEQRCIKYYMPLLTKHKR